MKTEILDYLSELSWSARGLVRKLWLVVRNRPLLTCPFCEGTGGAVSGYYEPEWTECYQCDHYWSELNDNGWEWFYGRLPLIQWMRAKVSIKFGLWYIASFHDVLRCKVGWHDWKSDGFFGDGTEEVCSTCWDHREKTEGR